MSGRPSASRRTILRGAALTPAVALGLTACGPIGGGVTTPATPTAPVDLGAESEVPEGGAKLYRDHNVVVSRGADGTLKAFSTICTHAQCPINKLQGTKLICPCHGSEFDATTGEVVRSPASTPLPELPVRAEGGRLVAGPGA
ncbi:Rieske 2Fe-2S domain-containing protein [Streptomyces sp. NPDC056112]|uniref:Rieske (2Fe-2S) protein n=1 Tax=unclassified Streptomyces TaxID=2593676 RepID=UPI0011436034|nr:MULTISPECIES: Rieske (2Fe-2S) protein [unclassified Streptomyces]GED87668.1 (Fe-S)-binding protein [Streptomyces sp. 6-11-2]